MQKAPGQRWVRTLQSNLIQVHSSAATEPWLIITNWDRWAYLVGMSTSGPDVESEGEAKESQKEASCNRDSFFVFFCKRQILLDLPLPQDALTARHDPHFLEHCRMPTTLALESELTMTVHSLVATCSIKNCRSTPFRCALRKWRRYIHNPMGILKVRFRGL